MKTTEKSTLFSGKSRRLGMVPRQANKSHPGMPVPITPRNIVLFAENFVKVITWLDVVIDRPKQDRANMSDRVIICTYVTTLISTMAVYTRPAGVPIKQQTRRLLAGWTLYHVRRRCEQQADEIATKVY
jgi:hypothetical protein